MNLKGTLALLVLLSQLSPAAGQVKNTLLGEITGTIPCANAVAVNPRNQANIVAVSGRGDVYVTKDGAATWKTVRISSGSGIEGNPALFTDDKGTYYLLHVSGTGEESAQSVRLVIRWSDDGGETWSEGDPVETELPPHIQNPWAIRDGRGNTYITWTQFEGSGDSDPDCKASVFFSMSKNGKKWTAPAVITPELGKCLPDQDTGAAIPAVTFDGKVMIAWSGKGSVMLDRSFNGGEWWLSNDITVSEQKGGASLAVPGHRACNATPVLLTDLSKSPFRGSLYISWADQRNGQDDTDVWFTRSHNFGDNWSLPTRINDDGPGKHQYMPWMTVDQATGFIYILYYDRRSHEDNATDVYLAWSGNGGASFQNILLSETPFMPEEGAPTGAYNGISAHKGVIASVWSRVDAGKVSVCAAVVRQDDLGKKN